MIMGKGTEYRREKEKNDGECDSFCVNREHRVE